MNIYAYSLDSLRRIVRMLQKENEELRRQIEKTDSVATNYSDLYNIPAEDLYDPDQSGRIIERYISESMVVDFYKLFWGRTDVYARRGKNGGYFPQCENWWSDICPKKHGSKQICDLCPNKKWRQLTRGIILQHLLGRREDGTDVVGVYPLFPDDTCRFIVFDFDNHEKDSERSDFANTDEIWRDEIDALRVICKQNDIPCLVERSRSGRGAHLWIFFQRPIQASLARQFGTLLLEKGATSINLRSFHYYDRMYPAQDHAKGIGNLIALPLQGQALKKGNSAFVDENWNAYYDQWNVLLDQSLRIHPEKIQNFVYKWQAELTNLYNNYSIKNRPKPWERTDKFAKDDVDGKMHIVLADGIYVDALNLQPRIQNQIRALAAFSNPVYYKNARLGYSNYYNFSSVYLGEDVNGYIHIPRGLKETLLAKCADADIPYEILDEREKGLPIRISFRSDLRMQQDIAAQALLSYDNGILSAATAFGKTAVCSYLIAQKKVSTLIIVPTKELLMQWTVELEKFLQIDEQPPTYQTKTGRAKKRSSVIGVLHGGKNTMTGIIDIAMAGSLYSKGTFSKLQHSYGMVIVDECHHAAAETTAEVLQTLRCRYVYGVSATPKRSDDMEKVIYMILGPVRHRFTALERAQSQGIEHLVYPRYTRTVLPISEKQQEIYEAYEYISLNSDRNEMILSDIATNLQMGRNVVVLTKFKNQAKYLCDKLKPTCEYTFLLYGDSSDKENLFTRQAMESVPEDQPMVLVATGQKIGEGFNYPRLDCLILASPISSPERLEQFVGRIDRTYKNKKSAVVYDYVDPHIPVFAAMYRKRLRTYRRIGFSVANMASNEKPAVNSIYSYNNYADTFEQDLISAKKSIVICSPNLVQEKVDRLIQIVQSKVDTDVHISVITQNPEKMKWEHSDYIQALLQQMRSLGIQPIVKDNLSEGFAIIDDELVWHGSTNLLGKDDFWDNLIRIKAPATAAELLELVL